MEEEEEREFWESLHCEGSPDDLGGIEYLPSSTSIEVLNELDLCPNTTESGDTTKYEYEHFHYYSQDTETGREGWHVNCCKDPIAYIPSADEQVDYFPFAVAQVFVSSVAAFFSLATILAMTLPLFKKKRRKRASTYNLYLVFLAIPDLMYNLFLVWLFVTYNSEGWVEVVTIGEVPWMDHPFDLGLFATCAAANLYMNAIIALEILKLLRNSKRRKRSKAPTLRKAAFQALFTYTIGAIIFVADYFGDDLQKMLPYWGIALIYLPMAIFIPIFILLWVCFRIYWEGLLGDGRSKAGKRLTILIRYFARIIVVYILIWMPAVIFYQAQFFDEQKKGLFYFVACILYAMSAWANFSLSLTKPDVRKNFRDLFTGRVCLPDPKDKNERPKFTASGQSNDINPKEKKKTTSTGEESMGVKLPVDIVDFEQGPAMKVEIDCSVGALKDDVSYPEEPEAKNRDSNIFDFSGADAPRILSEIERSRVSTFGLGMLARRSKPEQKRNSILSADTGHLQATRQSMVNSATFSTRSHNVRSKSVVYSSAEIMASSISEPFEIQSTAFKDSSRRGSPGFASISITSRDTSDDPSRSGSHISNEDLIEPKKPPSVVFEDEEQHEENPSSSQQIPSATSAVKRPDTSGESTGGISFFMDRDSTGKTLSKGSKMSVTTAFFMDQSSSDRSRQQSTTNFQEEQRGNWIQGMKKNIWDLAKLMKKPGVTDEQKSVYQKSIHLKRRALQSVIISATSELTPNDFPDDSSSDLYSEIFSSSDLDIKSEGSIDETRYSNVRWMSELRLNIHDLNLRLEQEDIEDEERALLSRAIESQELTLASIEGIGANNGVDNTIKPKNVDHTDNSAFVASPLDVIDDESFCEESENAEK